MSRRFTDSTLMNQLALLVISVSGGLIVLFATPFGSGLSPDSIHYLDGAKNIALGRGYVTGSGVSEAAHLMSGQGYFEQGTDFKPITHWPPFYAMTLASGRLIGIEPWPFSRWLNALLLVGNAWLLANLASRFYGIPRSVGLVMAFILVTSWTFLSVHTSALSEPLFVFFVLVALWQILSHVESSSWTRLLLAASAMAFATFTRYMALPIAAAGAIAVLLFSKAPLGKRCLECVVFSLVALAGFVGFAMRNHFVSGESTDTPVTFQGLPFSFLRDFVGEFSFGLLPGALGEWGSAAFGVIVLGMLTALGVIAWRKYALSQTPDLVRPALVVSLFLIGYFAFLVFGVTFVSLQMRWELRRYLAPLLPLLLLFVFGFFASHPQYATRWRPTLVAMCAILVFANVFRACRWCSAVRKDGQQYASLAWQRSPTMDFVRGSLPPGTVFSNGYEAIPFFADRPARPLPVVWSPRSERPLPNTKAQFQMVRDVLATKPGYVVWFKESHRNYMASVETLQREAGLKVLTNFSDGVVLAAASPAHVEVR